MSRDPCDNHDGACDFIAGCDGTGVCRKCRGRGVTMDDSFEEYECDVCAGTGECPCVYNHLAHEKPVAL